MMEEWIRFGSLLVAIIALIWQQRQALKESRKKEKRIEVKLRIFYVLSVGARDMDEPEIGFALEQGQPLAQADKVEIRKSLYEMLSESTIRYTTERKYRPRDRAPGGPEI